MRRSSLYIFVGAVALLVGACRDAGLEPNRSAVSPTGSASLSKSSSNQNHTVIGTIELSPNGGTYHVGDFDVVMPAGAVCDPKTAKYGPKHWDDDCIPARQSITVSVVAQKQHGQVSIDFQPDIRFRPAAGSVRIETRAYSDLLTSSAVRQLSPGSSYFDQFAISYVPTGKTTRIDEVQSTGDRSLATHVDLSTGVVWRRVKHFSGYTILAGDKCDPTQMVDANACLPSDPGSLGGVTNVVIGGTDLYMPSVIVTP
jgi:hypothetical protein